MIKFLLCHSRKRIKRNDRKILHTSSTISIFLNKMFFFLFIHTRIVLDSIATCYCRRKIFHQRQCDIKKYIFFHDLFKFDIRSYIYTKLYVTLFSSPYYITQYSNIDYLYYKGKVFHVLKLLSKNI